MRFRKQIFGFGNCSSAIIIPKTIMNELGIVENDLVDIDISKITPTIRVIEKNGKIVEGDLRGFLMMEGKPALEIVDLKKDKSFLVQFDCIKDISEINKTCGFTENVGRPTPTSNQNKIVEEQPVEELSEKQLAEFEQLVRDNDELIERVAREGKMALGNVKKQKLLKSNKQKKKVDYDKRKSNHKNGKRRKK